jgi:hypothetical protein
MKKLLLLFFCCIVTKTFGQNPINLFAYLPSLNSNFEDRDASGYFYFNPTQTNNIWQIGTPFKIIFNSSYSAPLALVTDTITSYPNENTSSFEFVMNTDDLTFISFWHSFNTDSLADGGVIDVSTDNGSSWVNIVNAPDFSLTNFYPSSTKISSNNNQPGFTGNSEWKESTISGRAFHNVRFRFTFTSDEINTNKDGWIIDNFNFNCIGTGINNGTTKSSYKIFPNPTNSIIFIDQENSIKIKSVALKNILGQTFFSDDQTTIDLTEFASGYYLLEITTDEGKYIERLQKQ